uniref:SoHo domain-containing protein n=1 Tax=Steinernema glaseri TaxID=37863 RepID=A0A1I7Z808_9BILA
MSETEDTAAGAAPAPETEVSAVDDVSSEVTRKLKLSDHSQSIIDESNKLLGMGPSNGAPRSPIRSRSSSPDNSILTASMNRYPLHTPAFPRITFDDMVDESIKDRKPSWKQLQESIQDSYHKAKRTVERNREQTEFMDSQLNRRRARRSESPFAHLDGESFLPRKPSWFASGAMEPRGLGSSHNVYAAPAVGSSQGIESRYDRHANDIEARLLKTTILPEHMKTITRREFRKAPEPSAGSASEQYADETDFETFMPRPYYSRPNRNDPDYFDFDLQHSVDMYKRPEGRYVPRGPQDWETKLLGEMKGKGSAPLSGYLFTKGDSDYRTNGSSYLSAALRTPSFWEHRFSSIGKEVRESNPVSMESIERNRPVPSRFTEYRDPDHEGYVDPYDSD